MKNTGFTKAANKGPAFPDALSPGLIKQGIEACSQSKWGPSGQPPDPVGVQGMNQAVQHQLSILIVEDEYHTRMAPRLPDRERKQGGILL